MGSTTSANLLSSGCRASPEAAPSAPGCCSRQVLALLPSHPTPALILPTHPIISHFLLTCPPHFSSCQPIFWRQGTAFSPCLSCTRIFDTGGALLACSSSSARLWCGPKLRQPHGSWASAALLRSQELWAENGSSTDCCRGN